MYEDDEFAGLTEDEIDAILEERDREKIERIDRMMSMTFEEYCKEFEDKYTEEEHYQRYLDRVNSDEPFRVVAPETDEWNELMQRAVACHKEKEKRLKQIQKG